MLAEVGDGLGALHLGQVGRFVEAVVEGEAVLVQAGAHGLDEAWPRGHPVKVDDFVPDEALLHRQSLSHQFELSTVLFHEDVWAVIDSLAGERELELVELVVLVLEALVVEVLRLIDGNLLAFTEVI